MLQLRSLLVGAVLYLTTSATPERGKVCYFSVGRTSTFEQFVREGGMKVSTGEKCSTKLTRLDELKRVSPAKEYFGAFHTADLILVRGAAHYMLNPDDMTGLPNDIYVCDHHIRELSTKWSDVTYKRIRYERKAGQTKLLCGWPFEVCNEHVDAKHSHRVSREEAKNYLMITGKHLHPGTVLCADHMESLLNAADDLTEEMCDRSWKEGSESMDEDDSNDEEKEETALQKAFFVFCKEAGLDRMCPKKSFLDYSRDTQTRKVRTTEKAIMTFIGMIAPGWENELFNRVFANRFNGFETFGTDTIRKILDEIRRLFLMADDMRTRDILLSQVAGALTYPEILPFFPGLSVYKYTKAKRIAATLEIPPVTAHTKQRWDFEMIEEFVSFIASPNIVTGLPYGMKTGKLSTGEKLDIPNVIRNYGNTEIIRQYRAYMHSLGKDSLVFSDSTMTRILNSLPATKRHSLVCVDSFRASGYEAFDDIKKLLDKLHDMALIDKEDAHNKLMEFWEIRLYLKTDYGLHCKPDSHVPDHSLLYALSDPDNDLFKTKPSHTHAYQCPRCVHIENTFRDLTDILSTLILNNIQYEPQLKEMLFNLANHKDSILELKSHELRSIYTNLERERIIESLPDNHCFITADYGQKMMPTKHYEKQVDYYGKKGLGWHFSHVLAKDSRSTVTILTEVLRELKKMHIVGCHIRSDNAPNYHSAPTLGSIPAMTKESGVTILSYSFSERQNGKGSADRITALAKSKIRREINAGGKVENQRDMFDLLKKEPLLPGVSIYYGEVSDPAAEPPASVITRVTDFSHFQLEGKTSLRAFKYNGIGVGQVFKNLHSYGGVYKELARGGFTADSDSIALDASRIRDRQPAKFWHYDPTLLDTVEPGDRDQDTAVEMPVDEKDGKKGFAYACQCGATFLRRGNYENHRDYGTHKIHPYKSTAIDESLHFYKRVLEEQVQVKSLIPLQDAIEKVYDNSVSALPMGWALRAKKKHSLYPAKTKKMIQDFVVERAKVGRRADHEEAFKRMVADASIPLEERMSKEQIKRLICRLIVTPIKKKKTVVRGKRSNVDTEEEIVEWKVEEIDEGEWEIEDDCEEDEGAMEDDDLYWGYIKDNRKEFFSD